MNSNLIKTKIVPTLIGIVAISYAIVLLIKTKMGLDSLNAFYVNLSTATGLSIGVISFSVGSILILFNTIISKKKFNWSALLVAFFIGSGIDLFNKISVDVLNYDSLILNIIIFILGIIVLGLGIAILIYSNMPSPVEEYLFAIRKIFKISTGTSKFYSDFSFFISAVLVGIVSRNGLGQINLGTLVITLVSGKIVGIWLEIFNRYSAVKKINTIVKI